MKKLLLITDVWNQVNGVVRTLKTTIDHLSKMGMETHVLHPGLFGEFKFPLYPEITCTFTSHSKIERIIKKFNPDYIHIVTEGLFGLTVRNMCVRNNWKFTTSYTTNIPEYGWEIWGIPKFIGYMYVRWFHSKSSTVMVARQSVRENLRKNGFKTPFATWSRGVDTNVFYPRKKSNYPMVLYVGRVSKEKNIESFLKADVLATKVVVGDGPYLKELSRKYPTVQYKGYLHGEKLADLYSQAHCLVFPSRTDTFGLVMLEALACGTPVATYPEYKDILPSIPGVVSMDAHLTTAIQNALVKPNQEECVRFVKHYYDWEKCSRQFSHNLIPKHRSINEG